MDRRDELLTPEELAGYLKLSVKTLHDWRYERKGPTSIEVGRHLRYRRADVDDRLDERAS